MLPTWHSGCDVYGTSLSVHVGALEHMGKTVKTVDKLKENTIIPVGRATPSGYGPDVAVYDLSVSSGVNFAFTNRFVALSERVRNTVIHLCPLVTTSPKTRQYDCFAQRSTGAALVLSCNPSSRSFFAGFTKDQFCIFVFGRSN